MSSTPSTPQSPKPAIASSTIWGGLIAAISPVIPTLIDAVLPIIPPQYQAMVSGALAFLGGIMAIWGRNNSNIAPIAGVFKKPN